MQPISRRRALASVAALSSAAVLGACSGGGGGGGDVQEKIDNPDPNINTDGLPLVKEAVTLKFMTGRPPTTAEDWDQISAVKKMEEMTKVHVDFGLVPLEGVSEKRNLALASGDYPGTFFRCSLGGGDIARYGEQGVLVPLNQLIDPYMPNVKAMLEEVPDVRKAMTFPDGNMYSLPQVYVAKGMLYMIKNWVRTDWLDKFGMKTPETLDEYEAYLTEAVKNNPSGKDTTIGLSGPSMGNIFGCLAGTFGLCNRGSDRKTFDVQPDDESKIRFIPTSEGYRELLTYLNRLYSKGLIQPDIYSTDAEKVNALGRNGQIASSCTQTPEGFYGPAGKPFEAMKPLKKQASDEVPFWAAVRPKSVALGQFVITDANEHPITTAQWIDQWFGPEGRKMFFMGVEGVSFHEVDGKYELLPEILEGKTIDEALRFHALYMGGRYPGYVTDEVFRGVENSPQALAGVDVLEPYGVEETWPSFTFTVEESDLISTTGADISKYAAESQTAFITGKRPLSEWDAYVAQFDAMGLDKYTEVNQAAMERYNAI